MKISYEWLNELISIPCSPEELGEKLTAIGLETESVEKVGGACDKVVVGEILEIQKHPQADKLTVCRVNVGKEELQIVCGAKNMQQGDRVPVALIGAKLPNGLAIKKSKLRGIDSHGMMCSSSELQLSEESEGLLILPKETPLGKPIDKILPLQDTILEINVTPNRGDCLSHLGVARECSLLFDKPIHCPKIELKETKGSDSIKVKLESKGCQRYTARFLRDLTLKPSPLWMQIRLSRCGVRPINNIVDVTNYVMLEMGQPLHAFDSSQIKLLRIRDAAAGESILTLDGKKHDLKKGDLVIANAKEPIALAGVMGGKDSEVSDQTHEILLESAYFEPARVRQLRTKIGVSSESSTRFERGVDLSKVELASRRASALIQECAGGKVLKGVIDLGAKTVKPKKIKLHFSHIEKILGCPVPEKKVLSILW